MLRSTNLTEPVDNVSYACQNFKKAKGTCRSGAPHEGIRRGERCPFDYDDQNLCQHFEN